MQSVRLVEPEGMRLVESYVVPMRPNESRTGPGSFPPGPDQLPRSNWRRAVPAAGAEVPPNTPRDLIVHVSYAGPDPATMSGLEITYTSQGARHTVQTFERLRIEQRKC